jgi:exonuclease III
MEQNEGNPLTTLNASSILDISPLLENCLHNDDEAGIFSSINIKSDYFDRPALASKPNIKKCPLLLSINIQSIQSKFNNLLLLIKELQTANCLIDIIALQETWNVPFVDQLTLPGFHLLILVNRKNQCGGGVGFYINSRFKYNICNNFPSHPKTFKNMVIEVHYPNHHLLLSCIYRSPNPNTGISVTNHLEEFMLLFDNHLRNINDLTMDSYIFLDASINLNHLNTSSNSREYLNTIISNGFLPTITKAIRINNDSATFINQILSIVTSNVINAGTLVMDTSDHFCNFISLPANNQVNFTKTHQCRVPGRSVHPRSVHPFTFFSVSAFLSTRIGPCRSEAPSTAWVAPGDHEPLIGGARWRSMGELRLGRSVTWSFCRWTYHQGTSM